MFEIEHRCGKVRNMATPTPASLLVVDDDADVLTAARLLLKQHFTRVFTEGNPERIPDCLARDPVDLVLLDMNFAIGMNTGAEGLSWLRRIRELSPDTVVVLMTAFGDLNTAVEAIKSGAADFVLKPWQNEKLLATLHLALELHESRQKGSQLHLAHETLNRGAPGRLVARSPAMMRVMRLIERSAPTNANILISGENGTGKELIAQTLHALSRRCAEPLIPVDLGAMNANLFESELFGHRKGAFTDARADRAGRFQAAEGGTLFLDEVANLPLPEQAKLLRALESREVTPLGADRAIAVDVRVVAASNRSLEAMVAGGEFREDLLYRLNTIQIDLPPLRNRREDIPVLVSRFLEQFQRQYDQPGKRLSADAQRALTDYAWPGNVRELAHCIERALILADSDEISVEDLHLKVPAQGTPGTTLNLAATEKILVEMAMRQSAGNVSQAAHALGITRAALYRRLKKFGLEG